MTETYESKDKILEKILLINFDEEKKLYIGEKNFQLRFRTKIQNLFTNNKKNSIKDYAIIVVCTQNSLSGTDDHFQESFQRMITRKENDFNFELLSKVDATRQCNRRSGSFRDGKKAHNVRTRVYYDPNKVELNFDKSKFEKSYNITSTNKSKFLGSNQSWTNTRNANKIDKNYSKITDFNKIQLFDYDISRVSGQDKNKPIIGEGLIDINMYFIYQGRLKKYPMRFTVRNHTMDNIETFNLSNEKYNISHKGLTSSEDAYLYTCTKNIEKNNRHPKTKITIFNKNNIKINKPVSGSQVAPEQEYKEVLNKPINNQATLGVNQNNNNLIINEIKDYVVKVLNIHDIKNVTNKNSNEYKILLDIFDNVLLISTIIFQTGFPQTRAKNPLTSKDKNKNRNKVGMYTNFIAYKNSFLTLKGNINNSSVKVFKNIISNNKEINRSNRYNYSNSNVQGMFNEILDKFNGVNSINNNIKLYLGEKLIILKNATNDLLEK